MLALHPSTLSTSAWQRYECSVMKCDRLDAPTATAKCHVQLVVFLNAPAVGPRTCQKRGCKIPMMTLTRIIKMESSCRPPAKCGVTPKPQYRHVHLRDKAIANVPKNAFARLQLPAYHHHLRTHESVEPASRVEDSSPRIRLKYPSECPIQQ